MLWHGAGLRLMECLRLRVKDVDFAANQIVVREGKGQKDRITMLLARVKPALTAHLVRVREVHQRDLQGGFGRVLLPDALAGSIPTPIPSGPGSGCFRRRFITVILRPGRAPPASLP